MIPDNFLIPVAISFAIAVVIIIITACGVVIWLRARFVQKAGIANHDILPDPDQYETYRAGLLENSPITDERNQLPDDKMSEIVVQTRSFPYEIDLSDQLVLREGAEPPCQQSFSTSNFKAWLVHNSHNHLPRS